MLEDELFGIETRYEMWLVTEDGSSAFFHKSGSYLDTHGAQGQQYKLGRVDIL